MKTVDVFSHLNDLMGTDGNNADFLELERVEEEREREQKVKGSFERRLLWKQLKQNMKEFAEENGFRFFDKENPTGSVNLDNFSVRGEHGDLASFSINDLGHVYLDLLYGNLDENRNSEGYSTTAEYSLEDLEDKAKIWLHTETESDVLRFRETVVERIEKKIDEWASELGFHKKRQPNLITWTLNYEPIYLMVNGDKHHKRHASVLFCDSVPIEFEEGSTDFGKLELVEKWMRHRKAAADLMKEYTP